MRTLTDGESGGCKPCLDLQLPQTPRNQLVGYNLQDTLTPP